MEYFRPKTMKETLHTIARWKGRARLIAGGTNVLPDLRAKALVPRALVDLGHLTALSFIKDEKKGIRIGGLTTISEIAASRVIQRQASILSEAANQLGNPLVRNRATLAGNLADASPAADTAVPLLALEAVVVMERDGGKRRQIPIDQFFIGPNQTVLKLDEIIKEIYFPRSNSNTQMAYVKLGLRNAMAISVVSIAVLVEMEGVKCKRARIGLGAVASKPVRAYGVEEKLTGREVSKELVEACCEQVKQEINPITDIRASAQYRSSMASALLRRMIDKTVLGKRK